MYYNMYFNIEILKNQLKLHCAEVDGLLVYHPN